VNVPRPGKKKFRKAKERVTEENKNVPLIVWKEKSRSRREDVRNNPLPPDRRKKNAR